MLKSAPRWQSLVLAVALMAVVSTCVFACPNCKEALAADPQQQGTASGFYYSILFMMSMPYLILGSFGCLAYVSIRRARVQQDAESSIGDPTERE